MKDIPWHFFLILACICYSFEWWMVRELHTLGSSSLEIAFYKGFFTIILIGSYFLLTWTLKENLWKIEKNYIFPLIIFGLIFLYGNSAYAEALEHTKVMNILVIMYLSIFFGIFSGWIFFGEKMKVSILLWAFLAFIGILLTLYRGELSLSFGLGEWLALTIAFTLTITASIVKWTPGLNTWFRLFIAYGIGTIILIFIISYQWRLDNLFSSPMLIWVGILYSVSTWLLGRWLKDLGTKLVPLGQMGIIMLLEPVLQIVTAALFAKEIPTNINIIGMWIVFVSIVGVSRLKNG
jgi:drug/metabolite transporter (DMT)-like permease